MKRNYMKKGVRIKTMMKSKIICPECGELKLESVRYWQEGTTIYSVKILDNKFEYKEEDFRGLGETGWYCQQCGVKLSISEYELFKCFIKLSEDVK